jgi:hypothetical protein
MKKLYINGSSITQGWPLNRKSIIDLYHKHYNIEKWADGDPDDVMDSEVNRLVNWPTRLSKLLNVDLVDESRHGGSINRVIRMTYEYIENNNIDDTLFILEFPSGYRDELFLIKLDRIFNVTIGNVQDIEDGTESRDDNKKVFNELNSYFKNFVDQETHFKKEFLSFAGLISYMKLMNVNFLIINQSITDEYSNYYPQIFKSLDIEDRIVKWDGGDCIVKWYWNDNNLHIGGDFKHINGHDDYHPGYFGHIKIAEYLNKYLNESEYCNKND